MHALGLEFGSASQLSKRLGSVLNCLWGNALKRSPGIIHKRWVSYPGPGFLSSATRPSLPKKHYNGLNQTKPNQPHSTKVHVIFVVMKISHGSRDFVEKLCQRNLRQFVNKKRNILHKKILFIYSNIKYCMCKVLSHRVL